MGAPWPRLTGSPMGTSIASWLNSILEAREGEIDMILYRDFESNKD